MGLYWVLVRPRRKWILRGRWKMRSGGRVVRGEEGVYLLDEVLDVGIEVLEHFGGWEAG